MLSGRKPFLTIVSAIALVVGALPGCSDVPGKPNKAGETDTGWVIAIARSGGMLASKDPFTAYRFTMDKEGTWKFTSGASKTGKVGANEVEQWLKEIEEGGFGKLKSNPKLGATDAPFMDISVQTAGGREQKRIPPSEQLAKAIDKKVVEIVGVGK